MSTNQPFAKITTEDSIEYFSSLAAAFVKSDHLVQPHKIYGRDNIRGPFVLVYDNEDGASQDITSRDYVESCVGAEIGGEG